MRLAGNNEPCLYCEQTPGSGAWNEPCPDNPDRLHWTKDQQHEAHQLERANLGRGLSRAAYELEKVAQAIESLPLRLQRKLTNQTLDPALIRNEAERVRDTLHVYGLLDV